MSQEQFQSEAEIETPKESVESVHTDPKNSSDSTEETTILDIKDSAEYQELNSKYLRLMAEFENFRRRNARESLDLIEQANAKLIGRLTEVLENFDRALSLDNKATTLEDHEKGVSMIRDQFGNILKEFGLEVLDPAGAIFDPNLHEALMQQPSEEIPNDHVAQVFQKGYLVKGKVIRHAKVIVSTGK